MYKIYKRIYVKYKMLLNSLGLFPYSFTVNHSDIEKDFK